MTRTVAAILALALIASCSNRGDRSRHVVSRAVSGPILAACLSAGRTGATRERCGCVQSVANTSLSSGDQRLGASFFSDPHRAQEIRQSDSSANAAFWERWKAFGDEAARICK